MQVFRHIHSQATTPCVLTIGNFDGLHRGHQALLERLVAQAKRLNLPATVMTFEPHPRELFAPLQAPPRLTSLREKLRLLESCGVDRVFVCRFNTPLAALEADAFVERLLVQGLAVRHLYVGDDFQFGRGRQGNFALLQTAGARYGFTVESMPTIDWQGERVSSSRIRDLLAAGELEHAARLLGRTYSISGRVVHGKKIGRQLGFPTANVVLKMKRVPLSGVFAVQVSGIADHPLPGAASLGTRPTIAEGLKPVLEVHLLDFEQSIYGAHVTVDFLHKHRDEARFDTLEELTAHIAQDVTAIRHYFQNIHHG